MRRKPQAKRQNHGGEQKNRKQNVNTLGKSHNGQGVAAKTANETANTWSRGTNYYHLSPHIRAHVLCAPPRARYVFLRDAEWANNWTVVENLAEIGKKLRGDGECSQGYIHPLPNP